MTEIDDLKKELESEKKKVSVLEQKLRLYELPGEMRGYYAMQRILNQQSDYLNKFELEKELKQFSKDDKIYDRSSELWEKLPVNISRLNALKSELNITGNEEKDTVRKTVSPESMAQSIGDYKTQDV